LYTALGAAILREGYGVSENLKFCYAGNLHLNWEGKVREREEGALFFHIPDEEKLGMEKDIAGEAKLSGWSSAGRTLRRGRRSLKGNSSGGGDRDPLLAGDLGGGTSIEDNNEKVKLVGQK